MDRTALIVVDVQRGFDDAGFFGPRNNTACEENVRALIAAWRGSNQPIVFVRHHWDEDGSPLRSDEAGSEFKDVVEGRPDLLVTKTVHSAFHGTPDLHDWLGKDEIDKLVICGIQTNMCCETTARVGSDLGYEVGFAIDATHTFDQDDHDGGTVTADELARVTASNLDPEFGRVLTAAEAIAELRCEALSADPWRTLGQSGALPTGTRRRFAPPRAEPTDRRATSRRGSTSC